MPRVVDHEARRAHLLEQGFRLMADEGYGSATMRRIARASGVSTGTLYHYFPDKPAILDGMFELLIARDQERVTAELDPGATVEERIRTLYRFLRQESGHLRSLLRLALEVHRHEPGEDSRTRVREAVVGYRQAMSDVLDIEGPLAVAAFSLVIGSLAQGVLDPGAVDLEAEEAVVLSAWESLAALRGG